VRGCDDDHQAMIAIVMMMMMMMMIKLGDFYGFGNQDWMCY
jgi:hypothetical protein